MQAFPYPFAGIAFVFGEMPDILLLSFQSILFHLDALLVYLGNKSILDCLDGVVRPLVILVQPELFLSDSGRYT